MADKPLHEFIDLDAYDVVPRQQYDRLREALERIVEMGDYVYKPHEFAEIARAALSRPTSSATPSLGRSSQREVGPEGNEGLDGGRR